MCIKIRKNNFNSQKKRKTPSGVVNEKLSVGINQPLDTNSADFSLLLFLLVQHSDGSRITSFFSCASHSVFFDSLIAWMLRVGAPVEFYCIWSDLQLALRGYGANLAHFPTFSSFFFSESQKNQETTTLYCSKNSLLSPSSSYLLFGTSVPQLRDTTTLRYTMAPSQEIIIFKGNLFFNRFVSLSLLLTSSLTQVFCMNHCVCVGFLCES